MNVSSVRARARAPRAPRAARTPEDRHPKGCESAEHHPSVCFGYLRTCPSCTRRVCWADGAADDADRTLPGICDACVDAGTAKSPTPSTEPS